MTTRKGEFTRYVPIRLDKKRFDWLRAQAKNGGVSAVIRRCVDESRWSQAVSDRLAALTEVERAT